MADLGKQQIKDTYNGLLKAEDSTQPIPASGTTPIEDGEGNTTALKLGRSGQGAEISGDLDVRRPDILASGNKQAMPGIGKQTNKAQKRPILQRLQSQAVIYIAKIVTKSDVSGDLPRTSKYEEDLTTFMR